MRILSVAAGALATVASFVDPSYAGIVTFGSGDNQFNMEFVTIGNPGNAADTTGAPNPAGAVGYTYDIGKFEVSRAMAIKYNANFGTANNLPIRLLDMEADGVVGGNGENRPLTGVSWYRAARFVNWLNDSQGFAKAYKFADGSVGSSNIQLWQPGDVGYDANNKYRNSLAKYFLPSYNEWYKAAYFSPGGTYYNFANGSDTAPNAVASGTAANTAVYGQAYDQGPADVTNAGGLSPYGVMGLDGNVLEWEESSEDLLNSSASSVRGCRGGDWGSSSSDLSSSFRVNRVPSFGSMNNVGFRVASLSSDAVVPEPSMMVIGMVFGLGGLAAKRRMKK